MGYEILKVGDIVTFQSSASEDLCGSLFDRWKSYVDKTIVAIERKGLCKLSAPGIPDQVFVHMEHLIKKEPAKCGRQHKFDLFKDEMVIINETTLKSINVQHRTTFSNRARVQVDYIHPSYNHPGEWLYLEVTDGVNTREILTLRNSVSRLQAAGQKPEKDTDPVKFQEGQLVRLLRDDSGVPAGVEGRLISTPSAYYDDTAHIVITKSICDRKILGHSFYRTGMKVGVALKNLELVDLFPSLTKSSSQQSSITLKTNMNYGTEHSEGKSLKVCPVTPTISSGTRISGQRVSGNISRVTTQLGHLSYTEVSG